MPALDPFSASSRPMRPFDSLPSEPLRFAATLRPVDQNTAPSHAHDPSSAAVNKLPKPKKYKDTIPEVFPPSPFLHSRHGSFDFREVGLAIGHSDPRLQAGSDEWMQERVAQCVDSAKGVLDLKNLGLTSLSTKIADMRDLVTLPSSFSPRASASSNAPLRNSRTAFGDPPSPIIRSPSPHLSPAISPGSGPLSANSRSFTRVVSAPASSASFSSSLNLPRTSLGRTPSGLGSSVVTFERDGESAGTNSPASSQGLLDSPSLEAPVAVRPMRRQISRSKTGAVAFGSPRGQVVSSSSVEILVAGNMLSSLPTALFEISNLTLLSLRGNRLKSLPAAIGELLNLRDLNISNNDIKELPSTILNLNLTSFHAHPNPFYRKLQEGEDEKESRNAVATIKAPSDRTLGPLKRSLDATVPKLYDICLNLLISPRPPSNLPPLLDQYEWEAPARGQRHPLLDVDVLADIIPAIPNADMRRALQALKSAGHAYGSLGTSQTRDYGAALGLSSRPSTSARAKVDPFPRSHKTSPPDDASENPYYCPCPSPRHLEFEVGQDDDKTAVRPTRHLFIHAAEERLEWRNVFDSGELPIRWRGCSPGCLAFLEEEEEDWGLDEEDEEDNGGQYGVAAEVGLGW